MPSPSRRVRPPTRLGFMPILLGNLLPLVGVLAFGWDPATLVVIYALELLFTLPLAGVKALFAQQPPQTDRDDDASVISVSDGLIQKRGSVDVVPWLPPVYPRNLPFATAVVGAAAWFVIIVGVVLGNLFDVAAILAQPEVLVSVFGLIVGQSVETWREYRRGGYETASPYTVIETPARQTFFLAFVLFTMPGITVVGVEIVLGIVVLAKLLIEWSAYRATQGGGGRLAKWLAGPHPSEREREQVELPDGDPDVRVPTNTRAVLYTGVFHVVGRLAPFYVMLFIFVWFLLLILFESEEPSTVVALASGVVVFAVFVGLVVGKIGMFYLRYGPLEYRRYGDRLVAYDTLLAAPQWSSSIDVLRNVEVVPDRLPDRLFDTRTIAVTTGWDDDDSNRHLGPVSDPDTLIEAFELPVRTTKLEPLDRRPAAVVIACLIGIVGTVVLLAIGPWISAGEVLFGALVYGVFGIPAVAFGLRLAA